ncbi:MAG: helicase HerA-like domain-containing protein, partial [Streptosporangiaceae bacterium]
SPGRDVPVRQVAAANPYAAPRQPANVEEKWPGPVPEAPFWASTALVAALARTPAREVPGVRMVLRPEFDVTPETAPGGFVLGEVLDWNKVGCGELSVPASSVNRHVFVCGATGSGKSQTIRHLLESASGAGIPWLVIEPAKAEYRLMAARLPGNAVVRIRPGELEDPAAGINPLQPAAGFPLQAHAVRRRGRGAVVSGAG